jgi:Rrf2 family protein
MLTLSTKGRYASRIMVYLASRTDQSKPARRQEIAEAEGISLDYVEQILMKLKAALLVNSHRGAKGGHSLGRDPESITVADVLTATEGDLTLSPCLTEPCERMSACVVRPIWERANAALKNVFVSVTIAELAKQAIALRDTQVITFDI